MAYISNTSNSTFAGVAATLSAIGSAINTFMLDLYAANARHRLIEELQAMDDDTLRATHGISRSQIVSYVFSDHMVL